MSSIPLMQVLYLVGSLDDSPGDNTARERFRSFLQASVLRATLIRDYIQECLEHKGVQYNRALQDLVNWTGHLLGFRVEFGRYQGVTGQVGHDGHWVSPTGFHVVVEVKTTEVYAVKTSTLVGYVDSLVSDQQIPNWDQAIGLYVVGTQDPEVKQLENAIVAEKRTSQLRVVGVRSLLALAEMMERYGVQHTDVLAMLRPSEPSVDSLIGLMERLVAGSKAEQVDTGAQTPVAETVRPTSGTRVEDRAGSYVADDDASFWLTPVRPYPDDPAVECIRRLVANDRVYAFGDRTPGRKRLKAGDWICFYATDKGAKGVMAHARVASQPKREEHPGVRDPEAYPWLFRLDSERVYADSPVPIDAEMRARLDAFRGRDPDASWAWFVQGTKKISRHDFELLIRHLGGPAGHHGK